MQTLLPCPAPTCAGSIRAVNILRILLARGAHVTFVPMTGGREFKYTLQLRQLGVQTFPVLPSEQWVFTAQVRGGWGA